MTTPAILAGTIPITLSAAVRHSGGGKEALEVSASHRGRRTGQLFNFQCVARPAAGPLFLLFTHGSHRRLFINQTFFKQSPRFVAASAG